MQERGEMREQGSTAQQVLLLECGGVPLMPRE